MQRCDEGVDFRGHHGDDPAGSLAVSSERVHGSRRDDDGLPGGQDPALVANKHLKRAVQHDERLVRAMMHMRRRLITRIRCQSPFPQHEVSHESRVCPAQRTLSPYPLK